MRISHTLFLLLLALHGIFAQQTSMQGLHVNGTRILNKDGKEVRLRGVNRPGTEYSCVEYGKIFDGPADQTSVNAIKSWKINSIRVPINEDCWLGTGGVDPSLSGAFYEIAIYNWVTLLTSNGLAVIVDLHWASSNPGGENATTHSQTPMPNLLQSPTLWKSVANRFKNNTAVIFDLFNEPFPGNNAWDSEAAWNCWRNGKECDTTWVAAGMQDLVDAVRSTGAQNIVMCGGIQYSTSLVEWVAYKPDDPTGNLAAAVHVYDFNFCRSKGCWDVYWRPVFENVPLIAGEMGQSDCETDFITDMMHYADTNGIHYLAWAWLPADCGKGPSIISDYQGTATNYGAGFKQHLDQLSNNKVAFYSDSFNVFSDVRTHWVDNWSTASNDMWFNETKVVHSGTYSIAFTPSWNTYVFYQCWGCINTSIHKGIEYWINGGQVGGQDIDIALMKIADYRNIGTPNTVSYETSSYSTANISSPVTKNKWIKAYLDLSKVPAGAYDGIKFRSSGTNNFSMVYLDDIKVYAIHDSSASSLFSFSLFSLFLVALAVLM